MECLFSFSEGNRSRFSPAPFLHYKLQMLPVSWSMQFHPKVLIQPKETDAPELNWQLLEFHLSKCRFFSHWLSKWHKEIVASRLLQLTAWPSPWLPKHFWIQWQTDGYHCSFQADIYARRDWEWRKDKKLVCAYVFWTELFFFILLVKKKKVSLQMGCSLNLFTSVVVVVCAWTCQFCVLSLRQWWLAVSLSIQMSAPNKQTLNWTSCLWIMMCGLSL